jgi:hypothetical protein
VTVADVDGAVVVDTVVVVDGMVDAVVVDAVVVGG